MSEQSDDAPARRLRSTGTVLAIWLTIGAAVSLTAATAALLAQQPRLPGRLGADDLTGLVALLGDVVARFASAATLGLLAAIVVFAPSRADDTLPRPDERLCRWMVRSAQLWFAASILMTFANPSFVEGMTIGDSFRADAWWLFVTSTTSDLAWVASSLVALAIMMLGWWGRGGSAFTLAWLAGAAATVFVAVTGGVSVGLDHDWATDAVGLATLASVTLCSGAIGALAAMAVDAKSGDAAIRRYHRSVPLLIGVVAVGYGIGAWQQLAGVSPFATVYGLRWLPDSAWWRCWSSVGCGGSSLSARGTPHPGGGQPLRWRVT